MDMGPEADRRAREWEHDWIKKQFALDAKICNLQLKADLTVDELAAILELPKWRIETALNDTIEWVKQTHIGKDEWIENTIKPYVRRTRSFS